MSNILSPASIQAEPESVEAQSLKIGAEMQVGISSFGAWMIGVSSVIGSFAFLIHASMIAQAGPLASAAAWTVASLMSIPLALILAELSSMFPTAGGPYVYKYFALKRLIPGMGEMLGFLTGWIFWIYLIVGYACMANGLCNLLSAAFFGSPAASPIWFGPSLIIALFGTTTALNLAEVREVSRITNLLTVTKVGMAVAFGVLAFKSPSFAWDNLLNTASPSGNANFWTNMLCVLPLAMAGFSGIEMAGCTSSETKDARKTVPRAILLTVATVSLIYTGLGCAIGLAAPYTLSEDKTLAVVPGLSQVMATAPSMAAFIGGPLWGFILTAGVVLSITSCAFSGMMSTARTSLSMAQTGLFPQDFAKLHPASRVPRYALIFQLVFLCGIGAGANVLSHAGILSDAYTFLGNSCAFIYAVLALLYSICLIGLRYTDPDLQRPLRLGRRGNSVAWIVAVVSALIYGFVAFACIEWQHQLTALIFLLAGIPIYNHYKRAKS